MDGGKAEGLVHGRMDAAAVVTLTFQSRIAPVPVEQTDNHSSGRALNYPQPIIHNRDITSC